MNDFSPHIGRWATPIASEQPTDQRLLCTLCPRECKLRPGDRGFCFVRENVAGQMVLSTYGRSTGFCIDPIEKKPLNHFYPGTPVLSFGTAGCNLGCKFCQNWDISKSREIERLSALAMPEQIAAAARQHNCRSVAFTYNDPVIWAEYAIDTAIACHQVGVKTIAVTAGYIQPEARAEFFAYMDAANVDLKAFTEQFYQHVTLSHLQPVLDTLVYLKQETDVWFEITNLIIPNENDSSDELRRMCDWILENLGDQVPIHFSAFHPDFRLRDRGPTPPETLHLAHEIAIRSGLKYPYVGNVHDPMRQNTYCPKCRALLIERDWYQLGVYNIVDQHCGECGEKIAGHFENKPGDWGRRRLPVNIQSVDSANQTVRADSLLPVVASDDMDTDATTVSEIPFSNESVPLNQASITVDEDGLPQLSSADQETLIHCAAANVIAAIAPSIAADSLKDRIALPTQLATHAVYGVFVTLHKNGQLRGCCGQLGKTMNLEQAIQVAARRTATADPRFPPVHPTELTQLTIDVSILGPLRSLDGTALEKSAAIRLGRDGLRIQSAQNAGVLLPQVATEQNWDTEQFLQAVCRKANLPSSAWEQNEVQLTAFAGMAFGSSFPQQIIPNADAIATAEPTFSAAVLQRFAQLAASNLQALVQGATPAYYAPDLPDEDVCGLVLTATDQATGRQLSWSRILPRPHLALQSTLFALCQNAYQTLQTNRFANNLSLGLSILSNAKEAGSVTAAQLEQFDPARHAILVASSGDWCLTFDRGSSANALLSQAANGIDLKERHGAVIVYDCASTLIRFGTRHQTSQPTNEDIRPPAVAGVFYESDDQKRIDQVDSLLASRTSLPTTLELEPTVTCRAVMTPHAGLKYSGQVAASVWGNIKLPDTVLIISPKHTRDGAAWAVAPFQQWQLSSTATLDADVELSQQIAARVEGMQLDASAHRREHGIEVQLPFIHRLAPQTRIAAIAMQGGSWTQISNAAEQLAEVLEALENPPLLVISSDMNHFLDSEETQRRDRLALDAFRTGDGELLLRTCREHEISMCGVIPAALILQTLKHLTAEYSVHEIAYATSADVSQDHNRVVGYASAILR